MSQGDIGGWLRRKGQTFHTWSRRWFILSDKFLTMYSKEGDKKILDRIYLDKQIIVEPAPEPGDTRGYFDIVTGSETISLCAETIEEKQTWLRALKRLLYAQKGGALFCQSLEEILFWEKANGRLVPYIVDECVQYLYKYALDVEGIFRLGGRLATIKEVISRFDKGEKVEFEKEETDVHVVASVLKAFLRDLPDSIIPCKFYQKFMNIAMRFMEAEDKEKEKIVADLIKAMDLIPYDNYIILEYVCNFLKKVSDHGDQNKMTMMNIGTIFGNNIIRHVDQENSHILLCTADLGQNLVYMLLNYSSQVFVRQHKTDNSDSKKDVATADLLHLSNSPAMSTPLLSQPSALSEDLKGLVLTETTAATSHSSNGSLPIVEDYSFDGKSHSNNQGGSGGLKVKKQSLHLSLKRTAQLDSSKHSAPTSPTQTPVVPPRRNKLMRNRPVSEKRRPRGMFDPPTSPESPLSGHFQTPPETPTLSTPDSENSSLPSVDSPPPVESSNDAGSGEYQPSYDQLLSENKRLKDDITVKKERYLKDISSLKSQLKQLNEKNKQVLQTKQASFDNQNKDLEKKLEEEKKKTAAAMNTVVKLKEKLEKYQRTYGELRD